MGRTQTVSFKATKEQIKQLDRAVEREHYTSKGEYLRHLLRKELQPELSEEAVKRIKKGREQIAAGNSVALDDV